MNSQALKLELISWLASVKNKKVLESINSLKDSLNTGDWYLLLTTEQKRSLNRGISDHKKGKFLSSKEFWSRYEKKI